MLLKQAERWEYSGTREDCRKAELLYRECFRLDPSHERAKWGLAFYMGQRALFMMEDGEDTAAALQVAHEALEVWPESVLAWCYLAECRNAAGDPHGAVAAIQRAMQENARAEAEYEERGRLTPNVLHPSRLYVRLAYYATKAHDYDLAAQAFPRARGSFFRYWTASMAASSKVEDKVDALEGEKGYLSPEEKAGLRAALRRTGQATETQPAP